MTIICPRGGQPPRTQPERTELASDLDRAAGHLWQRGNYRAAASLITQARVLDPARASLWAKREAAIAQAATRRQARTGAGEAVRAARTPGNALERQLAEAGIAADDPALEFWRTWNRVAYARRDADREPGQ